MLASWLLCAVISICGAETLPKFVDMRLVHRPALLCRKRKQQQQQHFGLCIVLGDSVDSMYFCSTSKCHCATCSKGIAFQNTCRLLASRNIIEWLD